MIPILVLLSATFPIVDSVYVNLSSTVSTDAYLQNHLFGVLKKPSLFDCAAACQAHVECLSFGFEPRKRLCHLHTEDETAASDDLVPESPWIHGNISAFPKELWGPCAGHNCTVGQECTTNRVTKQAVCVKGKVAQPETLCPVPPCLDNASISSGGRKPGDSRTYTCEDGYLDTESFLSSGVTTCLPNSTWSHLNLTCSGPFVTMSVSSEEATISYVNLQDEVSRDVIGESSLVFYCKACSNCIVRLCEDPNVTVGECPLIAITNNVFVISVGDGNPVLEPAHKVVSCTEFRPFWINWLDGTIAVGMGSTVGSQVYIQLGPLSLKDITNVRLGVWWEEENSWLLLKQN